MNNAHQGVLVLGAGSWGTALALVIARNGYRVWLWGHNPQHIEQLQEDSANQRYLPGQPFPETITPIADFADCPVSIVDVVSAIPCMALRSTLENLGQGIRVDNICLSSKGLEPDTQLLGHEVVQQVLPQAHCLILSGPSFAREVAAELPTAVTLASNEPAVAEYFAQYFQNEQFRVYTQTDLTGVAIAGAVKNVMAIAAGIADGLGYGANTRAALITRGLAEILRLATAMQANPETFMGLAGLGDLVLTCTDDQSRNRQFGLLLAQGHSIDQAQLSIGQAIEGINTIREVNDLARRFDVEMPISYQVLRVIDGDVSPREAVVQLLQREPRSE